MYQLWGGRLPDPKSRARAERLLRGDFRPDDLTGLFLYARDHCDGREAVSDIGHFVAHHNERDRGIITRSTREWFAVARFHMARFGPGGPYLLHGNRMPQATRDYFQVAIGRFDAKTLKAETGLRKPDAFKRMKAIAENLTSNTDGTWALPAMTSEDNDLVNYVTSQMVIKPAFEDSDLFDEFSATLKSNGLITKEELRTHTARLRPLIYLFAVSAMHNCVVRIGDGTTVQLKAWCSIEDKSIAVGAAVPLELPNGHYGGRVSVTADIFKAHLDPAEHCHPDLLSAPSWDFELEVDRAGKLAPLR